MSEELNIDEQIANVDASIAVHERMVKKAEALKRLMKSEDFHLVITDGYLVEEADRVYQLLMSPRVSTPADKESYLSQLETIKNMYRYLGDGEYPGTVMIQGLNSTKTLEKEIALKQELIERKA